LKDSRILFVLAVRARRKRHFRSLRTNLVVKSNIKKLRLVIAACQGLFFSVIVPSTIDLLAAFFKDPFIVVVSALGHHEMAQNPLFRRFYATEKTRVSCRRKSAPTWSWLFTINSSAIAKLAAISKDPFVVLVLSVAKHRFRRDPSRAKAMSCDCSISHVLSRTLYRQKRDSTIDYYIHVVQSI